MCIKKWRGKERRGRKPQLAAQKKRKSKQKPYIYFSRSYYSRLNSAMAGHSSERVLMIRFASWSQLLVVSLRGRPSAPPPILPCLLGLCFTCHVQRGRWPRCLPPLIVEAQGQKGRKNKRKKGKGTKAKAFASLWDSLFRLTENDTGSKLALADH